MKGHKKISKGGEEKIAEFNCINKSLTPVPKHSLDFLSSCLTIGHIPFHLFQEAKRKTYLAIMKQHV